MHYVRNALGFSLALAALVISIPVGRADSLAPPAKSADSTTEAVWDEMTAVARQAAAAEARKILQCLKEFEALGPKPTPDWARNLSPGNTVAASSLNWNMPDGTLNPALGGVPPTELAERLHHLAYTGRLDISVYSFFRGKIVTIPLGLHASPKDVEGTRGYCFFDKTPRRPKPTECQIFCQGAYSF